MILSKLLVIVKLMQSLNVTEQLSFYKLSPQLVVVCCFVSFKPSQRQGTYKKD